MVSLTIFTIIAPNGTISPALLRTCRRGKMSSGFSRKDVSAWASTLHTIGAAEAVEVVYIDRPQISLHGIEDIRHIHAQLLGFGAVEMGEKLRHAGREIGEHARQGGVLGGFHLDFLGHLIENRMSP